VNCHQYSHTRVTHSLVLPLSRRIYQSLQNLSNGSKLSKQIAIGCTTGVPSKYSYIYILCVFMIYLSTLTEQHPGVKILAFDQISVATSYWTFKKRPDGRGRCKLNNFQRTAIDLACSSDFVMIQGPPGRSEPWQHQLHIY